MPAFFCLLFFDPEDGGSTFPVPDYMASPTFFIVNVVRTKYLTVCVYLYAQ
jgi:hypothetical protein